MKMLKKLIPTLFLFLSTSLLGAARTTNYDFPPVDDLPFQKGMSDPFLMADGTRVQNLEDWGKQREYIQAMLAHYLYGKVPPIPKQIEVTLLGSEIVFEGAGVKENYSLSISRNGKSVTCLFVVLRPSAKQRYPTIIKNDRVALDEELESDTAFAGEKAVRRGYLFARFNRTDLATDTRGEGRDAGVYPLYPNYDWTALSVWGWGHALVLNALNQVGLTQVDRVVATGHSRGGKAALYAGIFDERIAITAPNSSGTGGTGSYRFFENGQKPQTIRSHVGKNERWFHANYFTFADKEEFMPFDSHFSRVLVAPRAFINCHAREDYHTNPLGTELTHLATQTVYEWMSAEENIAIHWRDGGHAQNKEDWITLLDFADLQFFGKPSKTVFNNWAYPDAELPFDWRAPSAIKN